MYLLILSLLQFQPVSPNSFYRVPFKVLSFVNSSALIMEYPSAGLIINVVLYQSHFLRFILLTRSPNHLQALNLICRRWIWHRNLQCIGMCHPADSMLLLPPSLFTYILPYQLLSLHPKNSIAASFNWFPLHFTIIGKRNHTWFTVNAKS